jgi:hypothetical protein
MAKVYVRSSDEHAAFAHPDDGRTVWVPYGEAGKAITAGFRPLAEREHLGNIEREEYGASDIQAGLAAFARGGTFGLSDVALTKLDIVEPETLDKLKRYNPTVSAAAEIAGGIASAIVPGGAAGKIGGLAYKGARAIAGSTKGARAAATLARGAAEGGLYGGGMAVSDAVLKEEELLSADTARRIGTEAVYGAAIGGALDLGFAGLGFLRREAAKAVQAKRMEHAVAKAAQAMRSRRPGMSTLDDAARQAERKYGQGAVDVSPASSADPRASAHIASEATAPISPSQANTAGMPSIADRVRTRASLKKEYEDSKIMAAAMRKDYGAEARALLKAKGLLSELDEHRIIDVLSFAELQMKAVGKRIRDLDRQILGEQVGQFRAQGQVLKMSGMADDIAHAQTMRAGSPIGDVAAQIPIPKEALSAFASGDIPGHGRGIAGMVYRASSYGASNVIARSLMGGLPARAIGFIGGGFLAPLAKTTIDPVLRGVARVAESQAARDAARISAIKVSKELRAVDDDPLPPLMSMDEFEFIGTAAQTPAMDPASVRDAAKAGYLSAGLETDVANALADFQARRVGAIRAAVESGKSRAEMSRIIGTVRNPRATAARIGRGEIDPAEMWALRQIAPIEAALVTMMAQSALDNHSDKMPAKKIYALRIMAGMDPRHITRPKAKEDQQTTGRLGSGRYSEPATRAQRAAAA